MIKRLIALTVTTAFLAGCGSSASGPSDTLFTLKTGTRRTYQLTTATLTLSSGAVIPLLSTSTLTMEVPSTTATNPANSSLTLRILDRKFNLVRADTTTPIKANQRLYVTQSATGILVHGFNNTLSDVANPANDKFVGSTHNPPFAFIYLPSPLSNSVAITYPNPFAVAGTGTPDNRSFSFSTGASGFSTVTTTLGTFRARGSAVVEKFSGFELTQAALVPDLGFVSGVLKATLPDGSVVDAIATLTSYAN